MKQVRIATRRSPLALWQAEFIKSKLLNINPDCDIQFVELSTAGDREQTKSLISIGGKSLFVKELQKALLDHRADIAVHSMKDMSVFDHDNLTLACICEREDPRDAFISSDYASLDALPHGATVGTASPRRTAIIKSIRPDIQTKVLRGNVGTRIQKCQHDDYDAAILAVAGLKRLKMTEHIRDYLDAHRFIPAIGQAAIGVECRKDDTELTHLLNILNHRPTQLCVTAERAVNRILGGDCHTPVAAYATIEENVLSIRGWVANPSGSQIIESRLNGDMKNANSIGKALGEALLNQGAASLIKGE